MAVPPKTDEAFLREVDDELRRDQMAGFWTRYGKLAIAVFVLALIVLAAGLFWRESRIKAAGVHGEQLQKAYDDLRANPKAPVAKALDTLAASGSEGYVVSAKFTQADLLLQKDDLKGAAARFGEVAADSSVAPPLRDLALIRQTSAEFDTLKPDVVIGRLKPLAIKGNPWFGSAGELVAAAYLRQNRNDLAGAMFAGMAREETVPETIRQRAVQMAGVLGIDAVDQPEEKKAQ